MTLRIALAAFCLTLTASLAAAKDLKITLDWTFIGQHSPFLLAEQRGFFKDEGLDVTIDAGRGSGDTVVRIASGAYDIGYADSAPLIKFNAENPDKAVLATMIVLDIGPLAVVTTRQKGITKPEHLVGKTIAAPESDAGRQLFPAFAKATGLNPASVKWLTVTPQLRGAMLARGEADAITTFFTSGGFELKAAGVELNDVVFLKYSDYGVDLFGNAMMASPAFAAANPEIVRKVNRAVARAWLASLQDPPAAIAALKKREPLTDEALELARLKSFLDGQFLSANVKANGLSHLTPARLQKAVDTVATTFGVAAPAADKIYSDKYLPAKADLTLPQ